MNEQESDEAADGQLVSEGMVELQYAQRFSIEKFQGGYRMITAGNEGTGDHKQYLVVPEGKSVPEDLAGDVVVLQLPIENVYCASSSMISLSNAIGALDKIKLCATDYDSWSWKRSKSRWTRGSSPIPAATRSLTMS